MCVGAGCLSQRDNSLTKAGEGARQGEGERERSADIQVSSCKTKHRRTCVSWAVVCVSLIVIVILFVSCLQLPVRESARKLPLLSLSHPFFPAGVSLFLSCCCCSVLCFCFFFFSLVAFLPFNSNSVTSSLSPGVLPSSLPLLSCATLLSLAPFFFSCLLTIVSFSP